MNEKLPIYGGQAVIEGVMMRGSQGLAIAVRDPKGEIQLQCKPLGNLYRGPISKMPFVRGLLGLWDALGLGMQALSYSANVAAGEEMKVEGPALWGTMAVSMTFGISLFFLAPAAAGAGIDYLLGAMGAASLGESGWVGNLAEGVIRFFLIVGYIWLIGFIPDIKRLYGYHGAEHKVINAFEAGAPLTPESAAKFPLEHPRCGTAFLLTVVIFSVILFSLLGPLDWPLRLASRVLLVPVLAGLAYEYLRFTAKYINHPLIRIIVVPNLLMQRLTTREPDMQMLEVSIKAFEAMRSQETTRVQEMSQPQVV